MKSTSSKTGVSPFFLYFSALCFVERPGAATGVFSDVAGGCSLPQLWVGEPLATLAADVRHLCNPTSVAHIRRFGNLPAFKLPTLSNATKRLKGNQTIWSLPLNLVFSELMFDYEIFWKTE
jgi:hypothetical protein